MPTPISTQPLRAVLLTAIATLIVVAGCDGSGSSSPNIPASSLVPIGARLEGPEGIQATVYATGVPMASAFALDSTGRLWVAASGATTHANDGVYLIARRNMRPVKVIAGLKGPLGLTWIGEKLYVASIGHVDAFSDLKGTRFSTRETILNGPVVRGENNNLVQAPSGRLLMGVSSSCDHCSPSSKWSATIVSFNPDGSDLRIYANGVRAAFGLAYYPGRDDLFVTMNQRDDLGARTPGDWLAVVHQREDWGFPRCYGQRGAACRGVPDPLAALDRHAAAGGVAIVTGQLGSSVGTAALVAEWQSGKVLRVELTRSGSSYTGRVTPFLVGFKNPLALVATRDGAILIGDWASGTIYRIAKR